MAVEVRIRDKLIGWFWSDGYSTQYVKKVEEPQFEPGEIYRVCSGCAETGVNCGVFHLAASSLP